MRLLFLADRLSIRGGADLHLRQVIEWCVEMGWKVTVAVGRVDPGTMPPAGAELIRVRGLASSKATAARLERLGRLMEGADVIHAQNVMNPEALRRIVGTGKAVITVQDHRIFCPGMGKTLPDGMRCRRPMGQVDCSVCLEDSSYREQMEELTRERLEALRGASLVVLSRYMAEELEAVGAGGAVVIPPWITQVPPKNTPGEVLVMAGRLVRHKGIGDGWRAWIEAGRPLPLHVMGEGPEVQELDGADHMGWVDHQRCLAGIGRARALIFPSWWQEPFGMLGIEALAQGTPVIASVTGGMSDWADSGCIAVEPGDIRALRAGIERLAADPEAALVLGEAGRAMVAERFSRRVVAPRLRAVYENR